LGNRQSIDGIVFSVCPDELDEHDLPAEIECGNQPLVSASDLEAGALTIEYFGLRGGSANVVHRGPVRGCYQPIPTLKRNCRLGMRPGICQQNVSRNQTHWTLVAAFPCWEQ
jgi:hypothetical protein